MRVLAAPRSGRVWVMGLLVVAYAGGLALPGRGLSPVVGTALGLAAVGVPVAVCWLTVHRVGLSC